MKSENFHNKVPNRTAPDLHVGVHVDTHKRAWRYATCIMYLSTPQMGGETVFLRDEDDDDEIGWIRPKRNSCLLFAHELFHRGNVVGMYRKTLLRGDCCRGEMSTQLT